MKSILFIAPEPHIDENRVQTCEAISSLVSSVLNHEKVDTLFVIVDQEDIIENIVYESINLEKINELVNNTASFIDIKKENNNFTDMSFDCILENYIRVYTRESSLEKKTYLEKIENEINSDLAISKDIKIFKKRILIIPKGVNIKSLKEFNHINVVFLTITADCQFIFKRITFNDRNTNELIILKENKLIYTKGCYSSALKYFISKDFFTIRLEDYHFKNKTINNIVIKYEIDNDQENSNRKHIFINIEHKKWKDEFLKILYYYFSDLSIFISYGNECNTIEYARKIKKTIEKSLPFIHVEIDKEPERYTSSLSKYIENLKNGQIIIALINEKYLNSNYCMGEMVGVINNQSFFKNKHTTDSNSPLSRLTDKIVPIVMKDTWNLLSNNYETSKIHSKWEEKLVILENEYENMCNTKSDLCFLENQKSKIQEVSSIYKDFPIIIQLLNECYNFSSEEHEKDEFSILMNSIYKKLKNINYPNIFGS